MKHSTQYFLSLIFQLRFVMDMENAYCQTKQSQKMTKHYQNVYAVLVGMDQPASAKVPKPKMNARLTVRFAWEKASAIVKPVEFGLANATKTSKGNTVNVLQMSIRLDHACAPCWNPVSNLNLLEGRLLILV